MADREKLIELVDKARRYAAKKCHSFMSCAECSHYGEHDGNCRNAYIAESLIANGVTVRECGRWEDEHGGKYANPRYRCPVCKGRALYKFEQDLLGSWKGVQALTDFCPNCGADMR